MQGFERCGHFSSGFAFHNYKKLEKYEISHKLKQIKANDAFLVRLDGVGITSKFKSKDEIFSEEIYQAMKYVIENIHKSLNSVILAYTFKDEISLLIDKSKFFKSKHFKEYRIEKILPILSGYTSSLFTQKISEFGITQAFAFDARAIVLPHQELCQYFYIRQAFAISAFVERICSFKKLAIKRNLAEAHKLESAEFTQNYEKCVGYVGYLSEKKWCVEVAHNFKTHWAKYFQNLAL